MLPAWPILLVVALAPLSAHARGGGPLPGLNAAEALRYDEGFEAFRQQLSADRGIGPLANGTRCYLCHRGPALGGQSNKGVTRIGRLDGGTFDPLVSLGGPLVQERASSAACGETVPPTANVVVRRNATSTLGGGLVEAIPDQQIIDRAAAQQIENPAMAGRVHMVTGLSDGLPHVGRFGWKAQGALIVDVVAEAMLEELGITNALFPFENAPNGNIALLAQCDPVPDPEDAGIGFLDKLTDLVRYSAPVPRPTRMTAAATDGEQLFHAIGCAFCHYAGYTAASTIQGIDGKTVDLYSDLLLHDIGTRDGMVQGDAQGNEFRTPPLWTVRGAHPYLHDGSARTVANAIEAHGGQAQGVRDAYLALSAYEQKAILKFLNSR